MIRAADDASLVPLKPWPVLLAAFGLVGLGLLFSLVPGDWAVAPCILLLTAGVIAAGGVVWLRLSLPQQGSQDAQSAAGFVALAGAVPLLASLGLKADWDSAALLLYVLTGLALGGAVLVLVSQRLRRIILSLLVLFHFLGIFVATTSVNARGQPVPWWTSQLWARVYNDYLHFTFLLNAYHFYSPDPGPPTLLWFRIGYADGSYEWVKIPRREDFPTRLEFQRRLGVTESANDNLVTHPLLLLQRLPGRRFAGNLRRLPLEELYGGPATEQFREPSPLARTYLQSYARHIAATHPHKENPDLPIAGIKVYRVVHNILPAPQFHLGYDPLDPSLFEAHFLGEYDTEGRLQPNDGFRYWRLPYIWVPLEEAKLHPDRYPIVENTELRTGKRPQGRRMVDMREVLIDEVRIHAGDPLDPHPENLR